MEISGKGEKGDKSEKGFRREPPDTLKFCAS